jgi:hypothetical protein
MNNSLSEFQELLRLYHDATEALEDSISTVDLSDIDALANAILKQRTTLTGIDQMGIRVSHLCDSWKAIEFQLDQNSRKQVHAAMAAAKSEATKLNELCGNYTKMLETAQNKRGEQFGNLGKRKQYLKAMKPVKGNYPKFIDSLY